MTTAIDLFAGAGGFTTGAQQAGVDVVWAANHWQAAVEIHAANHQTVEHSCQDLMQADWRCVPDHDILLASPACQGHSQAGQPGRWVKGVMRRQQADRNTAWAVVQAAETKRPTAIVVENVADFLRWPLLPAWQQALEILGYTVERHTFDAADFGTPQNRLRAIVTASLRGPLRLTNPEIAHEGFGRHIDWETGNWAPIASKTPGVRARIAKGRARGLGRRFITHHVTGHPGRRLSRPIGCITTKAQWGVVDGSHVRMLTKPELRSALDFPSDYELPSSLKESIRMLGNAIPVQFAREIVRQTAAHIAA